MGKGQKHLCKWDKDEIRDKLDALKEIVTPARFICRKCGRVAKHDQVMCKPVALQDIDQKKEPS